MVPRPASRRLVNHSRIESPLLVTPFAISIGENACTCIDGTRALTRAHQIGVARHRQLGVDAALHAHLGRAGDVRLPCPVGHLGRRQRVRVGVAFTLGERAEPAPRIADVGEVDVAVDDECHVVAHHVAAQ